MIQYGKNKIGIDAKFFEPVIIGFPSRKNLEISDYSGSVIGNHVVFRPGTTIYCDVTIGDHFSSGHNVIIREETLIGNNVSIGTGSIVEGYCRIGCNVNIQSYAFIPIHTTIGDHVFIGPHCVLTNDRYPPTGKPQLSGPNIHEYATIGANTTILPAVSIGRGAAVAAGSVVTKDVPDNMMAIGAPARLRELPKEMVRQ